MEHDDIFGKFEPKENISAEEFVVYEWVGKQLYKKTYTRKYLPGSRNGGTDSYKSEAMV